MVLAHFTTSEGNFTARLFDAETPNTVANFTGLAEGTKEWTDPRTGKKVKQPYYDGTVFHRVIDGFMAWGVGLLGGPSLGGFLYDRVGFSRLALGWAAGLIAVTVPLAVVQSKSRQAPSVVTKR